MTSRLKGESVMPARIRPAPARHRLIAVVVTVVAVAFVTSGAGPGSRPVKVMTQNVYLGSDLVPVLTAQSLPQLLAGARSVYLQVQANDFPSRARALAI